MLQENKHYFAPVKVRQNKNKLINLHKNKLFT